MPRSGFFKERQRTTDEINAFRDGRLKDATELIAERRFAFLPGSIEHTYLDACITEQQAREAAAQEERERQLKDAQRLARAEAARAEEAEKRKRDSEAKNRELESLLEEAARSDRLVAEEKLGRGEDGKALAYLARASRYTPKSSLSAEAAIPAVLSPTIAHSQATFQGHTDTVVSAVFSPDGRRMLTASGDKTARLWKAESGKLLATFQGHTGIVHRAVFSPDGRRVLTASGDNTARLWEADNGKLLATFQGHTGWLWSAVFSPDGRRVLTASGDNTVRLWEAESGKLLATFQGHTGQLSSAVFSPDGRRVLTASADKTARLWPLLPAGVPRPDWCGDFLVWLGGKRIAADGQIETLPGDELVRLEDRLRRHVNEDSDYGRLLRWRLLPPQQRSVDPYGTTTQEQAADLIIRPDMNRDEAQRAYDLDPWHPLVHMALVLLC